MDLVQPLCAPERVHIAIAGVLSADRPGNEGSNLACPREEPFPVSIGLDL
jgi:hypothetical protein